MSFYDDWVQGSSGQSPSSNPFQSSVWDDWNSAKPEPKQETKPWWDSWIETGLRTGPAIAGGFIGGALGLPEGGIGAIPGGMAGGAAGSAIGNLLGNWYSGKEFNPVEFGVDTLAGAVPPILGPAKLGGQGLKELLKYGASSAIKGGLEGAAVNAALTPFQHYAQTGDFGARGGEYIENALSGGLFGGVLGGGMGLGHGAHTQARIDALGRGPQGPGPNFGPMEPPLRAEENGQYRLPGMENFSASTINEFPPSQTHIPPSAPANLNFGEMPGTQPDLPFQYRGDQGRFTQVGNIPLEMRRGQLGESPFTFDKPATMEDMAPPGLPFEPPAEPQIPAPFSRDQKRDALIQAGYKPQDVYLMGDRDLNQVFETLDQSSFNKQPEPASAIGPRLAPREPLTVPGTEVPVEPTIPPANTPIVPPAPPSPPQEVPGVIFKGDLAIITHPSPAIGKLLTERGYESIGVVNHFPTWKLKDDISQTALSRSQTTGPTTSPEGLTTVGPNDEVRLPKAVATRTTLQAWENEGYKVVEVHDNGDVTLGPSFDPNTDVARQKVTGGGLKIDSDNRRAAINLTKDYTGKLPGIMDREGLQNALDAVKPLGPKGVVKVRHSETDGTIEIYDNGGGLDETALGDKLTRLFATGKENEAGATGGKGIGSASYIVGGKHFEIETVAVDSIDGKKYKIRAWGTPEEFHREQGSNYERVQVPDFIPTGTTIKVELTDAQRPDHIHSRIMSDKIIAHSRDMQGHLLYDEYDTSHGIPLKDAIWSDMGTNQAKIVHKFKASKDDKLIGDIPVKGGEAKIKVPKFDPDVERDRTLVHVLNNGMYQYSDFILTQDRKKAKGIPEHVLVDIHPNVDEQHDDYPFINTREHVKKDVQEVIDDYLERNITGPEMQKKKNRVQELYDTMSKFTVRGTNRMAVFYDPGDRLTPNEKKVFTEHPITKALIIHFDHMVDEILNAVNRPAWMNKLEGVGIILDPGSNGIHIPNPRDGKSSIGFNPFIRIDYMTPEAAAWHATITALHEAAHIGKEAGGNIDISWNPTDLADPRIGRFMKAYADQMTQHGDINYTDTGHKLDYMQRLQEVFSKYGVDATFRAAEGLERIYTGGVKNGGYSTGIQRLSQLYKDSRGRPEVTDDLLSRTGVKQSNRGPGATGTIPSNAAGLGGGTSPPGQVKKPSLLREAYNFARGATTTGDLSAPLRQGLPLIFTKEYWKSLNQMRASLGDEKAFQKTLTDLQARPLFQKRPDPVTGKPIKSFAEMAGMKLSDLKSLSSREEAVASNWVEKGGFLGSDVPYLNKETGLQRAYQGSLGRGARATNRAYTAFLNQLRADSFESLLKDAHRDFKAGTKGAKNPYTDLEFAKEIADFVNTATGRGPLKLAAPGVTGGRLGEGGKFGLKEYSGERFAPFFTDTVFSPRLMASRVRMLNPATYAMATPFVRKQYLKSLFSVVAFAGTVGALAKGMGADVSLDPNSSDFGKVRIGNTRLDMMGGFQQYGVAASRLLTGHVTSSASGKDFELGQGYRAPTRGDIIQNFAANKAHPIVKFAYDMVNASTHQPFQVGDRTLQLFVPLIIGDVLEIMKQDPKLLPLIAPVVFGAGSQTYDKGASMSKFIPKEYDPWNFTGGSAYR